MIPSVLDRAVAGCALAQIARLPRTPDSKTDQTAQTDRRFEIAKEFDALAGHELTRSDSKLTSGDGQRSVPRAPNNRISRTLRDTDQQQRRQP
jgi:hypothetical protein